MVRGTHFKRLLRVGIVPAVLFFLLAPMLNAAAPGQGAERDSAQRILEAAGVQGGLIVHVGCGDGRLTAALRASDSYLVHGLDTEDANVAQARKHLRSLGVYGKVSADRWAGTRLPYADDVVGLLVAEHPDGLPSEEVMRVLRPGGVAMVGAAGDRATGADGEMHEIDGKTWQKLVKPWPDDVDQWTHYLHGPDNNAVAHDARVSSPFHVQWVDGPKWARHHNHLSSTSAMVSANGRVFAIVDEGPIASLAQPPKWTLVARDAFSGVVLWKKPVGPWEGVFRPFRSGPRELARRLVAVGDRVYVTLGYHEPVTSLDAATGGAVRTYAATKDAVEIVHDGGVLYAVVGTIDPQQYAESRRRGRASPPPRDKRIVAVVSETGRVIWSKSDADTWELLPTTLCVADGRAFFQSTSHLVCLDAASGREHWRAPRPVGTRRLSYSAPTVVVHGDVVLSADCSASATTGEGKGGGNGPRGGERDRARAGERRRESTGEEVRIQWTLTARPKRGDAAMGELIAFSTEDGQELWRCPTAQGYNVPADVFVADGLVWASYAPGRNTVDFAEGRDLHTGEVKRRLETDAAFTETHHHRCYRNKATDRFIVLGRTGVELIDLGGAKPVRHCWVRGACQYGVMPANGLLYAPPHACACYIQSKLSGFWALAPKRDGPPWMGDEEADDARLTHGPAYSQLPTPHSPLATSSDWPTYRHDPARTGRTESTVPAKLQPAWQAKLGGRLTSPVVAEGKLLVAAIDGHTIHALDADTGKKLWHHTVGGRVDSPPTIHQGSAMFGSADGFVYCLRLADGALVWRFRACPADRRIVAFGQVESVWPVTGSVLVHDGVVYCTAGRSSFLDGGMVLYRLDAATGRLLTPARFDSRDPETGQQREAIIEDVELPGALPDVLVCDGEHVYLRDKVLDLRGVEQDGYRPHLYSSAGLLDDTWWHRTYWLWGERTWGRASGWHVIPRFRPSGRILVTDQATVLGYGRKSVRGNNLSGYHLFRADKEVIPIDKKIQNNNVALMKYQRPAKVVYHWSREVPLVVRGMCLAGDVLLAAGPPMRAEAAGVDEPTFDAEGPGVLMTFDAEDGADRSRLKLDAPSVFDGLIAAGGKVYLALTNGTVLCMGESSGK
jgi:outer membrane protein assembly factor BamB